MAACNITTWDGVIFFDDETQNVNNLGVTYYGFKNYDEYKDSYDSQTDSEHAILIDRYHYNNLGFITYSQHKRILLCHMSSIRIDTNYWALDARSEIYNEYYNYFSSESNSMFIFPTMSNIITALRYKRMPKDRLWYCIDWSD